MSKTKIKKPKPLKIYDYFAVERYMLASHNIDISKFARDYACKRSTSNGSVLNFYMDEDPEERDISDDDKACLKALYEEFGGMLQVYYWW